MKYLFFLHALLLSFSVSAQHKLHGKVTNQNGEPLIGASVFLENTYYASISDDRGNYQLENVDSGEYSLKVSYLGYASKITPISAYTDLEVNVDLGVSMFVLQGVEISNTRIDEEDPFASYIVDNDEISKYALGQDVPYLLQWTPSAVVTSDAGTGIGYTGIRLRGINSDQINVTINGITLNDAESHGVFWVDVPDFSSSVEDMQIQRGVGSSSTGSGSYGGSIHMNTNRLHQNAYLHANTAYGSFNTRKMTINLGTGLLNNKYTVDGRYSLIKSDGYIDRASSDLKSWYFSAARLGDKSSLRFVTFSGTEETYQSWNGAPEALVNGDIEGIKAFQERNYYNPVDSANLFQSDRRYNFYTYQDQVDRYQQDHYQLHYAISPVNDLTLKGSLFYTKGSGYYEEFKSDESYDTYGLPVVKDEMGNNIQAGDLIRRRWLDNDYYGLLLQANYDATPSTNIAGGATFSDYSGEHFGTLVSAQYHPDLDLVRRYYNGLGTKREQNIFVKTTYSKGKIRFYTDLQYRGVDYKISGNDDDNTSLMFDNRYNFFNPKLGFSIDFDKGQKVYFSVGVAQKEPTRADLINNIGSDIFPEVLYDFEGGFTWDTPSFKLDWNNYYMQYDNQLVLTGDINNVGAYNRMNVGKSYRLGIEIMTTTQIMNNLFWNINASLSRNKIDEFSLDFGDGGVIDYKNTDISFSPNVVIGNAILYRFNRALEMEFSTKYVSSQYLDNTSNDDRMLPAYTYTNVRFGYDWDPTFMGKIGFNATVYNIFNSLYSNNGYSYTYFYEGFVTENFLYPQAGLHATLGMNIEF